MLLPVLHSKSIAMVMTFIIALAFSMTTPGTAFAINTSPEYAVKAAYIFNILRFTESADSTLLENVDEIKVCLLGESKFGQHILPMETKHIDGKPLRIINKTSLQETQNCQLVFISNTSSYPPDEISNVLGDKKIIVVGDDMNFVESGGMFAFYIENEKVRLGLNKNALDKSGLKVSSMLLEVCTAFGDKQ
jgi:hypothetical protein